MCNLTELQGVVLIISAALSIIGITAGITAIAITKACLKQVDSICNCDMKELEPVQKI